jgi:hypothetical protein
MRAALPGAVAAVASLVVAFLVLQLWNASLRTPWTLGGSDLWSMLLYMKMTLEQTWPLHNPLLGAPFGLDLQEYPLGDPLQILLTKLIGVFSGDVAVVTNVYFLVGFPLTALSALWAFRRLEIEIWIAVACAVLFAAAPYHFLRGEDHVLIASIYTVPFAAYLIITQLAARPPSLRTIVVLAVVVGLGFNYYVAFTVILLAFAVAVSLAARRRDVAGRGALALAVMLVVAACVNLPGLIYRLDHGSNQALATLHGPDQSERFGLKVPRMVFPVEQHEISPLARLTQRLNERSPTQIQEGPPQALGLLAAIGFVALLWIAVTAPFRRSDAPPRDPYLQASATATLVALVLGVAGGAALVFAYTVSPLVRSWSRLSIFIAFFALVAVGKALGRLRSELGTRGVRPAFLVLGLCALVAAAAGEQTSKAMVPYYKSMDFTWKSDAAFTARAVQLLPPNSFVLELPHIPYPEVVYGEARPYLHTDRLRWTFGAMSGRPADWVAGLNGLRPGTVVASAAAAGASAILVERNAYADGGKAVTAGLQARLGAPRVVSSDGTFELYDLRSYAQRLRQRLGASFGRLHDLVLHPVIALPGSQLSPPQTPSSSFARYSRISYSRTAVLDLVNPMKQPRAVQITLHVTSNGSARRFTLRVGSLAPSPFAAHPSASITLLVTLAPGRTRVTIADKTPPQPYETRYFNIDSPVIRDQAVQQILSRAG